MKLRFASSFRGYQKKHLKDDFLASLVVTAIAIPESLGFAAVVGLPLVTGLYCALAAPLLFAILTSSRRVIVGADSATAALVAAGGSLVAVAGTAAYSSAIVTLGILTGLVLVIMAFAKFGFLANFISKPVLIGFFGGVGVQLMLGKLPEILGLETTGTILQKLVFITSHFSDIHLLTVTLSIVVFLIIFIASRLRLPAILAGIVFGTIISYGVGLGDLGVKLVGDLPSGFPRIIMPDLNPVIIVALLPTAISIALVVIAQGTVVIRDFGAEHGEKTNLNQDIFAFGIVNIVSAITHGFAINGSPPRTLAAEQAKGHSQMVNVFMSILVGLVLLFATGLFAYVPVAVLAVIVFVIGFHLVRITQLRHIYMVRRTEFFIAVVSLLGVALLGVRQGVLIAVIVSLMERLHRQYHPSDQILLRDDVFSDWARERVTERNDHSHETTGLLIYRFNGSIFFENSYYFSHRLREAIAGAKKPVQYVIIDAGAIDEIDYTAVEMLRELYLQLKNDEIQIGMAHVAPNLQQQLEKFGVVNIIGHKHIYPTMNQALLTYPKNTRDVVAMIKKLEFNQSDFVVIGGSVMEVLGLRSTNDVDMVVEQSLYDELHENLGWHEFIQDNGECILSHEGFHAMRSWLGWDASNLKKDALIIDNIHYMNPSKLMEGKQRVGRKKDIEDVILLQKYLRQHSA